MKIKTGVTLFLNTMLMVSCVSIVAPVATATFISAPTATMTSVAFTPDLTPTTPSVIKFSGEGNAILTVDKWRGPALIHINYIGSDKLVAWNDNDKDRLLDFILSVDGNYSGTQVLDLSDQESFQTHYLEIYTNGSWEVDILPFEYGRKVNVPSVFTGSNNDVVFLKGNKPSSLEIEINGSGYYFSLSGQGDNGFVPIVNGKPPYHGTFKIEQDLKMLMIEAPGSWQIKVLDAVK